MKTNTLTLVSLKTNVSINTIRRYVDDGVVDGYRDGRGFRVIRDTDKAIDIINKINSGELLLKDLRKQ